MKNTVKIVGGVLVASLFLALNVHAAEFITSQDKTDSVISLPAGETHKNVYVAGGSVVADSAIDGDIFAAGGTVTINGAVTQDVMAASGTLFLNGTVGGDARVTGGTVVINGKVAGDVLVTGGTVKITDTSEIGGDLIMAGGTVAVNAPVHGMVMGAGGSIILNSKIDGVVKITGSKNVTFGSRSDITSNVNYRAPQEATMESGAHVTNPHFSTLPKGNNARNLAGILTIAFLIKFLAWIIAGLIFIRLKPTVVADTVSEISTRPWQSLGIGFLSLIVIPVAAFIVLITFVGYYVAIVTFIAYVLFLALSALLSAIVIGYKIVGLLHKPGEHVIGWQAVIIGVAAWILVKFIPIVGAVITGIIMLMVFGIIVMRLKRYLFNNKQAEPHQLN